MGTILFHYLGFGVFLLKMGKTLDLPVLMLDTVYIRIKLISVYKFLVNDSFLPRFSVLLSFLFVLFIDISSAAGPSSSDHRLSAVAGLTLAVH